MQPLLLPLLLACAPEHEITEIKLDAIAVVAGDFDRVEEGLLRELVPYQVYEGYISRPVYDASIEPEDIALKAETLLATDTELGNFGALFVNSGTRGLGQVVYNGVADDNAFLVDPLVAQEVKAFVDRGGVLVASDWAYDLVELIWPDAIDWVGDDTLFDDAQRGTRGPVSATVHTQSLVDELGEDRISVDYDYSYWSVIETVSDDVTNHVSGPVAYRLNESDGDTSLADSPLLVSFSSGSGTVVFSAFHWRAQSPAVADGLLFGLVGGLQGEELDTADTGADLAR